MYEIVTAEGGSLPTIIDSETKESVLGLDERVVQRALFMTPVFRNMEIALKVLDMLNSEDADV